MRLSGVKGDYQELRELRQQPYCLSPLLMIFFSQETTFAGRSHSCSPYKQHALEGAETLHIAKNFHFLLGVFKAFALTGRQANAHKPRALPWTRSFCPFRACCYGLLGLSAARKRFVSMRSHTAKCSSAAGEDL